MSSGTVLPLLALADDQVIAEAAIADPVTECHTALALIGARLRNATVWFTPFDERRAGGRCGLAGRGEAAPVFVADAR